MGVVRVCEYVVEDFGGEGFEAGEGAEGLGWSGCCWRGAAWRGGVGAWAWAWALLEGPFGAAGPLYGWTGPAVLRAEAGDARTVVFAGVDEAHDGCWWRERERFCGGFPGCRAPIPAHFVIDSEIFPVDISSNIPTSGGE